MGTSFIIGTNKGGGYALVIAFQGGKIRFGKKETYLEGGIYVYSGSALSGIMGRIERHRSTFYRIGGKRHWHIDALLETCDRIAALCALSGSRTECKLVRILASAHGMEPVYGFGSTDCRAGCGGHLLRSGLGFEETIGTVASAFREMGLEPSECGRWDRPRIRS